MNPKYRPNRRREEEGGGGGLARNTPTRPKDFPQGPGDERPRELSVVRTFLRSFSSRVPTLVLVLSLDSAPPPPFPLFGTLASGRRSPEDTLPFPIVRNHTFARTPSLNKCICGSARPQEGFGTVYQLLQ